jgi:hypothetical protein
LAEPPDSRNRPNYLTIRRSVHILRVVIASPRDVWSERAVAASVLEELNRSICLIADYALRLFVGKQTPILVSMTTVQRA